MGHEWHGNVHDTIVMIGMVCGFGWVPVVVAVSVARNIKKRFEAKRDQATAAHAAEDEENRTGGHPKQPELLTPTPTYQPGKQLERSMSTRTSNSDRSSAFDLKRWDTNGSWDPIRPFDFDTESFKGGGDGLTRNNTTRTTYSRHRIVPPTHHATPTSSRASSTRSVRSRRGSTSSMYGGSPAAFQINDTYYDTTPLPTSTPLPTFGSLAAAGTRAVNNGANIGTASSTGSSSEVSGAPSAAESGSPSSSTRKSSIPQPSSQSRRGRSVESPRETARREPSRSRSRSTGRGNEESHTVPSPRSYRRHRDMDETPEVPALPAMPTIPGSSRLPPSRRGSLHEQTFEGPNWTDQPHAI
ncbi:hypothetical protein QBC35DRAFT_297926 [Podospora australis]|uniref:Uncharacterized protein n=1 Tax=Podospora australis TaxID=1536484 RepID=A0AAN6WPE6_9PEZI|nr:hypothetical protein QBC35DRAFT_297926 [Podospora australis]